MIITASSGSGNLGNYLINGNDGKRDKSKIKIIDGDFNLTQEISNSLTKYKKDDRHFHFILSTKEKLEFEQMEEIYNDFKKELLDAYESDEVNISAVIHNDTDHSHIHVQVPKINMLTNTKLDLYYHKRDKNKFQLISQYLDLKYNLQSPLMEMSSQDKYESQTKNWKPNTTTIKNKKEKLEFEQMLTSHINDSKNILFENHDELISHLKDDLELNISKVGYDYKVDKFYITLQHENSKQRVFHPLFNNGKLKYKLNENKEKVYEQCDFKTATTNKKLPNPSEQGIDTIRAKLDKENQKYSSRIEKRTGSARKKAKQRDIESQNTIYNYNNINSDDVNISDNLSKESNRDRETTDTTIPTSKSRVTKPLLNPIQKVDYINQQNKLHKNIQDTNKLNLLSIAKQFFNYQQIKSTKEYSLIKSKKHNKIYMIYKNTKGLYNFINPFHKQQKGGVVGFLLNEMGIGYPTQSILFNIFKKFFKDINDILSSITDITATAVIDNFLASTKKAPTKEKELDTKRDISKKPSLGFTPRGRF